MSAWNGHFSVRTPHSAARTPKVLTNVNAKMGFTGLTRLAKVRASTLKFWTKKWDLVYLRHLSEKYRPTILVKTSTSADVSTDTRYCQPILDIVDIVSRHSTGR